MENHYDVIQTILNISAIGEKQKWSDGLFDTVRQNNKSFYFSNAKFGFIYSFKKIPVSNRINTLNGWICKGTKVIQVSCFGLS